MPIANKVAQEKLNHLLGTASIRPGSGVERMALEEPMEGWAADASSPDRGSPDKGLTFVNRGPIPIGEQPAEAKWAKKRSAKSAAPKRPRGVGRSVLGRPGTAMEAPRRSLTLTLAELCWHSCMFFY